MVIALPTAADMAKQLLGIMAHDETHLEWLDRYYNGDHDDPYMPANADDEYRLLARRCVTNHLPLLVRTPGQALYVDSFRQGHDAATEDRSGDTAVWDHWQRSGLDSKQVAIHYGALVFGHSFAVTERDRRKGVVTRGLSAMSTAALFEDPANDLAPYAVLHVYERPKTTSDGKTIPGKAWLWDDKYKYEVSFDSIAAGAKIVVKEGKTHGATECPVTRFAMCVDLEGRTVGVVEPMIPLQDRINQTVFDLLVAQTYSSFKVRWVTGMAPPLERDPETGEIVLDDGGNPKPLPINHNARRFLFAEDQGAKFGTLDETPLDGYIKSIEAAQHEFSALGQIPPHHLLGQIANLSAEALLAAETSLQRLVEQIRKAFGESWERVFRIAAELEGMTAASEDFSGEVIWRDMEQKSLAASADALGKLSQQLGIPQRGLWKRVPGVTQNEIEEWIDLADQADAPGTLAGAVSRATTFLSQPRDAAPGVAPGTEAAGLT